MKFSLKTLNAQKSGSGSHFGSFNQLVYFLYFYSNLCIYIRDPKAFKESKEFQVTLELMGRLEKEVPQENVEMSETLVLQESKGLQVKSYII